MTTSVLLRLMTTEQRLDQLEDEFETVKQILASAARYAESANEKLDRFIEESRAYQARTDIRMEQVERQMQQTEARMQQTEARMQQTEARMQRIEERMLVFDERFAQFIDRIEEIEAQAAIDRANFQDRMQELAEQAERDRNQANLDRAEFRTTVEGILNALTQRFNGNGNT
ncbi:hypothetical protein ACQ4M3_29650 [Leptolyngbya sp. AN03gr2]|uniref:hypothetical protein n=1 Tax=unclassified Leptolyngbya TaxID=2650499 RepID=UPI003D318577